MNAFRTVVILRDIEGLSYNEIAETLRISLGTVKSRILRGRECCGRGCRSRWPTRCRQERRCKRSEDMTCHAIRRQIGRYLDADLGFLSRWLLRRHLLACPACFDDYEERGGLGDLRNELPAVPFPLSVRASVLVAVSHRLNAQPWERLRNQVENFLRPRAVPATGGVLAGP